MVGQAVKRRVFGKIIVFEKLIFTGGRATPGGVPSADTSGQYWGQGFQFCLDLLFEGRKH
jgi:hypothetical protein